MEMISKGFLVRVQDRGGNVNLWFLWKSLGKSKVRIEYDLNGGDYDLKLEV